MGTKRALIVVDVQNDFTEGGALAVAGGKEVALNITDYLTGNEDIYDLIVATRDWHKPLPDTNQGHFDRWPVHCVAGTEGADYDSNLILPAHTIHVVKGQGREDYSGFEGSLAFPDGDLLIEQEDSLLGVLLQAGIRYVDVVGLAFDHCVKATALDAVNKGDFEVTVLTDLTAGVSPETSIEAAAMLTGNNVSLELS